MSWLLLKLEGLESIDLVIIFPFIKIDLIEILIQKIKLSKHITAKLSFLGFWMSNYSKTLTLIFQILDRNTKKCSQFLLRKQELFEIHECASLWESYFCLQFNHIANTQIFLPDPSIFPRTDLGDEFNLAAGRQPHLLEKFSITNSINLLCIFEQTKGAAGAASSLWLSRLREMLLLLCERAHGADAKTHPCAAGGAWWR